jgi:hypothetical protein
MAECGQKFDGWRRCLYRWIRWLKEIAGAYPVSRTGIPLSAANAHDSTFFEPVIAPIPAILGPRGRPGRPRKRPATLHADKAYDLTRC